MLRSFSIFVNRKATHKSKRISLNIKTKGYLYVLKASLYCINNNAFYV